MERSRQVAEREAGPKHMLLLRFLGGVLWGSQARAGLVNSNQKSGVVCKPDGSLI